MTVHEITRLGHKGDGITAEGVFVAGALPGETVEGEAMEGRVAAPRIVTASPDRVRASCRHYRACGGCALQHASDQFVADWKRAVVRTALQNQEISIELETIHTSPAQSRRRAAFHGRRTKKGVMVGLHARASDTLVPVPDCLLMVPEIMAAYPAYERLVEIGSSRRSEMTITVIAAITGLDVAVAEGKPLDLFMREKLADVVREAGFARLSWNGEVIAAKAPSMLQFGPAKVEPPAGAFLQATQDGEAALVRAMQRAVAGADRVIDLFSGCGTFSLPLAEGAEVHAVEGVAEMLEALGSGWRSANGLKRVTTETRDLFRRPIRADELVRYDAAVIDPPRAGALAQCQEIAKSDLPTVGFVSCNPVTFARDVRVLLQGGYALDWVEVVDQFRWSTHVEIAASFSRP